MTHLDEDLKARVRDLRAVQERDVPPLDSILDRTPERVRKQRDVTWPQLSWRPRIALAAAAGVAAAVLWVSMAEDGSHELPAERIETLATHRPSPQLFSIGQWAMPTDVLLDLSTLPGDRLLREAPEIGTLPTQIPDGAYTPSSAGRNSV